MGDKIEQELRFTLRSSEYELLRARIAARLSDFGLGDCSLETTVMYDNPNPEFSFFAPEIDGRLRLRTRQPASGDFPTRRADEAAILTWKQRIPEHAHSTIRKEREIEVQLADNQADGMRMLLTQVLRCPRVSSYERRRETLYYDGVEIALDLFPYGRVVELELKPAVQLNLLELAHDLGLAEERISILSCDDMYRLLCKRAGRSASSDILFADSAMPTIDEFLELPRGV